MHWILKCINEIIFADNIEIYSTHNKEKFVVTEKFTRISKNKMHAFNVKKVYIDNLDNLVNKYNNTYHSTIKIKPLDVKSNIRGSSWNGF